MMNIMKDAFKVIGFMALIAVVVTLMWVFFLPLFGLGMVVDRKAQIYQTETQSQAYETSRQYQQGTIRDLSRYCHDYTTAEGKAKTAMADLIRSTSSTYTGPLPANVQSCISQVGE